MLKNKYIIISGIFGSVIVSMIFIAGCTRANNPPQWINNSSQSVSNEKALVDCGTSVDISTLREVKIVQNDSTGTSTLTTKDYESDKSLVCFGNHLLTCDKAKVVVNINNNLSEMEVKGKNGSDCIIRARWKEITLHGNDFADRYLECPIKTSIISSEGCSLGMCGSPGATTVGLLNQVLWAIQDIKEPNGNVYHKYRILE